VSGGTTVEAANGIELNPNVLGANDAGRAAQLRDNQ
jgi:hypothetical protein